MASTAKANNDKRQVPGVKTRSSRTESEENERIHCHFIGKNHINLFVFRMHLAIGVIFWPMHTRSL